MKLILEIGNGPYMSEVDRGEAGIGQNFNLINPETKKVIGMFTTHFDGGACIVGRDAWNKVGRIDLAPGDYKITRSR